MCTVSLENNCFFLRDIRVSMYFFRTEGQSQLFQGGAKDC